MTAYANYKSYILSLGYTTPTTCEEYSDNKCSWICEQGHTTNMTVNSYKNKRLQLIGGKIPTICTECKDFLDYKEEYEKEKKIIKEKTGHTLISIASNPPKKTRCVYTCVSCNQQNETDLSNLKRNKGNCPNCQRKNLRCNIDDIKSRVEKDGYILVKYEGKENVRMKCPLGHEFTTSTFGFEKRERRCPTCRPERTANTNMELYNVRNQFQRPEIQEKSRETSIKNHGFPYHLQNPENLAKLEAKTEERLGVKYAFMQSWVYEKIKRINRERFGVDFPLQNDEIREKIKTKCMEKYGALFFMLTEKFKNVMIEKYGDKDFVKTEKFKQIMIERYGNIFYILSEKSKLENLERHGSEFYINTDKFREEMVKKYGVEYALQNKELFDKMIASSFRIKEFTLPKTGRKLQYMGYEDDAILYILDANKNICEDSIITNETRSFDYIDNIGKNRVYHPDFSIKNTRYIFEVKSIWTYNLSPELNYHKFTSVANYGYILKVVIYKKKGVMYDIWTFEKKNGVVCFSSKNGISEDKCKNVININEDLDLSQEDIDRFLSESSNISIDDVANEHEHKEVELVL